MGNDRVEYLLRLDGMADAEVGSACRFALELVADEIARAETDIPWDEGDDWPAEVMDAASRLRDRFVPAHEQGAYMQTGVRSTTDPDVRADFITFAPYALDAGFWGGGYGEVAHLNDEGSSVVTWLTDGQRRQLAERIGPDRVVTMTDWNAAHPSWLRRLRNRLRPHQD